MKVLLVLPFMLFFAARVGLARESVSLEKLDSAAGFLTWVVDQNEVNPTAKSCKLSRDEAGILLRVLHARLNESIQARVKQDFASDGSDLKERPRAWLKSCEGTCHCGLYAKILESIGSENLNAKDLRALKALQDLAAEKPDTKVRSACLDQTRRWFCKSALLKSLRKSAKDFQPAKANY